ncbi:MAG: FGGY-family carbohydrate kinase [Cardiobacteriaceae bacterium]|nr:FGGY-family carbohydrate kinase [Cardiobacteriaceae bacterium]
MEYWIGLDCGGTFIKAAAFDVHGNSAHLSRRNVPVISDHPGYAERDPETLWQVCADVIRDITAAIPAESIRGIGISAQGKGLFSLDKDGNALGRGILSSDQRALPIVKRWQAQGIPDALYAKTRQTLWTGHPVSILRALKESEPDRYQQIAAILMAHDYLRYRLTGQIACEETNISESNLYHFGRGDYDRALAQTLGIEDIFDALPPIVGATQIAGHVHEEAARATGLLPGTPVVGGLFDVVSTALCAGLEDENVLNVVLGTWSVVTGMTDHIDDSQTLPFVYGKSAQAGEYIVHEASPTSAANLEWVNHLLGDEDYRAINEQVAALPKAAGSVFFLPFLYGSNAGLGMQAGFYGLQSFHQKAHLYQAVYEGVLFSLMTHLERIAHRFPSADTLRVTGGPAKSAVWMQMLADISGKTVEIPAVEETGCLGAAMAAMVGTGAYQDVKSASRAMQGELARYHPDPACAEAYRSKYRRYRLLVEKLQAFNQALQQDS